MTTGIITSRDLAIGLGVAEKAIARTPLNLPGFSSLVTWHDIALSTVTLNGTLLASGTTPPVVTISGGTKPFEFRIEIQTGGARGTAAGRWSSDGGTNWNSFTTAATVTLGTTGWTANFPTGTYTNDNVYQACTDSVGDLKGSYTMATVGGTVSQAPLYQHAGFQSKPCAKFNGSTNYLMNSSGLAAAILSGANKQYTVYIVCSVNVTSIREVICCFANSVSNNTNKFWSPGYFSGDGGNKLVFATDTGSQQFVTPAITASIPSSWIFEATCDGTTVSFTGVDSSGATTTRTLTGYDTSQLTVDLYAWGATVLNSTANNFGAVSIAEDFMYSAALSSTARSVIRSAYKYKYFGKP